PQRRPCALRFASRPAGDHLDLRSFPTRRSSDLADHEQLGRSKKPIRLHACSSLFKAASQLPPTAGPEATCCGGGGGGVVMSTGWMNCGPCVGGLAILPPPPALPPMRSPTSAKPCRPCGFALAICTASSMVIVVVAKLIGVSDCICASDGTSTSHCMGSGASGTPRRPSTSG